MTLNSKEIGNITEVSYMLEFMKLGYPVLTPYGDCQRYDFIVKINNTFYKIQAKTANVNHINEGYISFRCDNTTTQNGKTIHHQYDENEIDFFSTFYNGKCYLIPVKECSKEKKLRFIATKNGQTKGISFAENYELEKIINNL